VDLNEVIEPLLEEGNLTNKVSAAGRRPVGEKQEGFRKNRLRLARASPARYTCIDTRGGRRLGGRERLRPCRAEDERI
jgi:hypothetical protein